MERDMDEISTDQLECALRDAASRHKATAPATLHDFIDTTARRAPAGRGSALSGWARRRPLLASAGLAAGLVVALAASSFLISVRSSQKVAASPSSRASSVPSASAYTPGPSVRPSGNTATPVDFTWQRVADPAPGAVTQVAHGFIGECVWAGLPSVCTSSDGLSWSLEPDPSIFSVGGSARFNGWSVAHSTPGWVASGTVSPGTWFSADGVHWGSVPLDVAGLERAHVQALGAGFAMVVEAYHDSASTTQLLTSVDGQNWTPVELPAGLSNPQLAGDAGLTATRMTGSGDSQSSSLVISADGSTWRDLIVPAPATVIRSSLKLAGEGYVAIEAGRVSSLGKLVVSTDGLTWTQPSSLSSWVSAVARVGSLVVAIGLVPASQMNAFWVSRTGSDWSRVALLDGRPLQAGDVVALGDRVGLLDSSRLAFVGAIGGPGTGAEPTPSTAPIGSPTPATPVASPATIVAGGWRWHQLTVRPYGAIVAVAHGYLAYCDKSMCTSPDGWTWSVPPDPSIFKADPAALFVPDRYGHAANGSYVVLSGDGAWYSPDGTSWKVSPTPPAPYGFAGLGVGPQGYSLSVLSAEGMAGSCTSYVSTDGAAWVSAGLVPCLMGAFAGDPSVSGGVLGQGGGIKNGGPMRYSADGRTWATATVPGATIDAVYPFRMPDGSLVVTAYPGLLLQSNDGLRWSEMPGWRAVGSTSQSLTLAVVGDRILVADMDSWHVWESRDDGATFHQILDGVNYVQVWGGLAMVENGNTYYIGEPLSAAETPGTTPTATGLPDLTPNVTPVPEPSAPSGGISKSEAIRIATAAAHPSATVAATALASPSFDSGYSRWTWVVSYRTDPYQGISVTIDYYTGEVLQVGTWIT
jgi:hypothetical protein